MKKLRILALTAILGTFFSVSLYAGPASSTVKKFLKALKLYQHDSTVPRRIKMNKTIRKYCNYVLNVDYMGRRAMRDNWSRLTPPQRREYMDLLTKIIRKIVYRDASNQLNDMRIRYRGSKRVSSRIYKVFAHIFIISERLDMNAVYVLEKKGRYFKVIDIFFDNESIVEDYRMEFNRIIRNHGVTGRRQSLLNRMRRTLRKNIINSARDRRRRKKKQQRRQGRNVSRGR